MPTTVPSKRPKANKSRLRSNKESVLRQAGLLPPAFVPAEPIRERIELLRASGVSAYQIADEAGVSHATVYKIARGMRERVVMDVAQRIMRLRPRPDAGLTVPPTGAGRRLRALGRMGWPQPELARRMGVPQCTVSRIVRGTVKSVLLDTDRKIRALYDELSSVEGPSVESRRRAEAKGWPSPWDWESARIDDPRSEPEAAEDRLSVKQRRRLDALSLIASGLSHAAVAERVGAPVRSVERWVREERESAAA